MDKQSKISQLLKYNYAHRGLHKKPTVPENSISAFKKAVDEGFGIELDLHLTKDNKLAVIHDASLFRTCGIDLKIEELTLEEAQVYFLEKSEEIIPEFSQVLNLVSGKTPLIIELKVVKKNHRELVEKTMKALEDYQGLYCIESFYPYALKYLRENYPQVIRGQLAGDVLSKDKEVYIQANEEKPVFDIDCVSQRDTGMEGTFLDESVSDPKEPVKATHFENFMLKNLWVNRISKPDFVAYKMESVEKSAFKNFKGAKFIWTVREYRDMIKCREIGAAPIFEQFNPHDYE